MLRKTGEEDGLLGKSILINKKIKKTVTAFTTKGYIKSYGKTERTLGKYAKQHKKEYKYFRTKMKIRAYKKQGKKKIYTKWSKEIKQM